MTEVRAVAAEEECGQLRADVGQLQAELSAAQQRVDELESQVGADSVMCFVALSPPSPVRVRREVGFAKIRSALPQAQ